MLCSTKTIVELIGTLSWSFLRLLERLAEGLSNTPRWDISEHNRFFVIFCEIDKDQMYLIYYKEMFFVISLHLENFSIEKSKKVSSLHTHVPSIMILAYIMQNTMYKTIWEFFFDIHNICRNIMKILDYLLSNVSFFMISR